RELLGFLRQAVCMKHCTLFYEEITFPLFCLASSVVHQVKKFPNSIEISTQGMVLFTYSWLLNGICTGHSALHVRMFCAEV
ncbi:MAG: hypothetical protein PUG62_03875, partial [Dialister sp.]|nr:hypothetical protein [Dialister sp.]